MQNVHAAVSPDAAIAGSLGVDLRREINSFTAAVENSAQEFFGFAITFGGVDEVDAALERFIDGAARGFEIHLAAEHHRATTKPRDLHAGVAEADVLQSR